MKHTDRYHDLLKRIPHAWARLDQIGVQNLLESDGNLAALELANCPCGSTLARKRARR